MHCSCNFLLKTSHADGADVFVRDTATFIDVALDVTDPSVVRPILIDMLRFQCVHLCNAHMPLLEIIFPFMHRGSL